METGALTEDGSLPRLLRLPNELLLETVASLSILDLRRLARVHRRLASFVGSYLTRCRYNAGIVKLPDELLLEVAQDLGTQADRSHFAQAILKFYPIVMIHVARYDVRHNGSSLLMYAAGWNLKNMARKIICLGGDVHTQSGSEHGVEGLRLRPLSNAAYHGHKRMVRLFLMAGALQLIGSNRVSLEVAIAEGHVQIAILLSQGLKADDTVREDGRILLKLACEAKMANLVKLLLECGYRARTTTKIKHGHSAMLHRLIARNAARDDFVKRDLHNEVYQIATMLLMHQADPDAYPKAKIRSTTARQLACRHPDPRLRLMLSRAEPAPAMKIQAAGLLIGPSPSQSIAPIYDVDDVPWCPASFDEARYATLWDFLKSPNADTSAIDDEDLRKDVPHRQDTKAENELHMLDSSELAAIVRMEKEDKTQKLTCHTTTPHPLTREVPDMLEALSKSGSYQFRDKKPVTTTPALHTAAHKAVPAKQRPTPEPFPPLGRTVSISRGNGGPARTVQHVPPGVEGKGEGTAGSSASKPKKKKKQWVPLSL